jgi:pimeloyl-ACP methyl ester carboxylesterase
MDGVRVLMAVGLGLAVAGCGAAEAGDDGAKRAGVGEVVESAALAFGEQRLSTGVRLHYAVQGDPAGPAVILLHGYSDSWFSYSPVLPLLSAGYRVYALDQRGHGESDKPRAGYHMADMAADVVAFMDARRIPSAVVVGHSLGSLVAQYVARAAPDRVAGLVLVAGAPSVHYFPGVDDFLGVVASFVDSVPQDFIREFQAGTAYQPLPDAFLERVIDESEKLPPHVWRGVAEGMRASGPVSAGSGTAIPTLVMWGDRDGIFPREAQDSLVARSADAELKVYPETGHALHWERPEVFSRDLTAFLERVAPAP